MFSSLSYYILLNLVAVKKNRLGMVRYLLCQFDYLIIQKYLIIKAHCYIYV